MSVPALSGRVFLLITGASQGIGRQIAESFAPLLGDGSLVLLLARSASGLQETAGKLSGKIKVHTVSVDLSTATADKLRDIIGTALTPAGAKQFEKAVIVHNAASVGDVSQSTVAMTDFQVWRDYYDLNVFAPAVLNGVFMEFFNADAKVARLVINITSKCGIEPFKSMAYYCSGKAAREMFFKVFAVEYPNVNVLNYSPGPVETDMLRTVQTNIGDPEVKEAFVQLATSRSALTTEQTVSRLVKILESQNYKSGQHVDYYDSGY
ncbi:sepiapterin reductase-like [Athalia rosae]|uniref:sepiapterin reductase-like n=1 Tax=Athalia rosae TaxID=37344 RepID=UPI0020339822|nr:sepiapterin reductase-like [Athalia rosae]XP_048506467.1 sepiapterin reductase-like [Athalia rosae]